MKSLLMACLAALACAACSGGTGPVPSPSAKPAAVTTRTVTPAVPVNLSASDIADGLKAAGLPIGQVQTYDASNDPNHLLGRPGQYTSKVNFADTRLPAASGLDVSGGGSIEVFSSAQEAQTRAAYLATISQAASGLLGEYDYRSGAILLRLGFKLTPDQAQQYATTLTAMTHQPAALATAVSALAAASGATPSPAGSPTPLPTPSPTSAPSPPPATPLPTPPSVASAPAIASAPPSAAPAPSAPPGATVLCNDGTYGSPAHRRGACSGHKGVASYLVNLPP